jgi:hypothetical protein
MEYVNQLKLSGKYSSSLLSSTESKERNKPWKCRRVSEVANYLILGITLN